MWKNSDHCKPTNCVAFFFAFLLSTLSLASGNEHTCSNAAECETEIQLEFLNSFSFPSEFDGKRNQFIGISSLSYDSNSNTLYGVSDDTGYCNLWKKKFPLGEQIGALLYNPFGLRYACPKNAYARMYSIKLETNESSILGDLLAENPTFLRDSSGKKITGGKVDLEGMTATPDGKLLMVSEQDVSDLAHYPPMLFLYGKDGNLHKEFKLPKKFFSTLGEGCPRNKCFEGVSLIPNSDTYVAITEQPLVQDTKHKYQRLIRFNLNETADGGVNVLAEHAYEMSPLEFPLADYAQKVSRGVSDILTIGDNDYLVIERSYLTFREKAKKKPLSVIRVFHATCYECTDLKDYSSLDSVRRKIIPMTTTLVLDMLAVKDEQGQVINELNIEGITWGPKLPDGSSTIIFVDDNGEYTKKPTSFLVFKVGKKN